MGTKKTQVWDLVGAYPICQVCGSGKVVRDAWAEWSMACQEWTVKAIFDHFSCEYCGQTGVPDWRLDEDFRKSRIRRLNDLLRRGQADHATIVMTAGVQAEGDAFVQQAIEATREFDGFYEDNDPHEEHDFGAFEIDGQKLFFKIDYFDLELQQHSRDAANPTCTHRVLTVMMASEY
ncbi:MULTISPECIES: DUF3768 domain-containing protein [Roseobacteraceae]|uniref:DUF3768 domain-containing protein n=1 Tax=Roseobacteraceae TaxID=2854170 RepID=UPI002B26E5EE|nr:MULTISPECIES: DUF3768 domain-containing protein [Roseobacteraceae]